MGKTNRMGCMGLEAIVDNGRRKQQVERPALASLLYA